MPTPMQLEAVSSHFQLRKSPQEGKVYAPVYGAPCAYTEIADFLVR